MCANRTRTFVVLLITSIVFRAGFANAQARWQTEKVAEISTGLATPECTLLLPSGDIAISNIQTEDEGYWVDDGKAYISLLDAQGQFKEAQWIQSTPAFVFSAPKGMCVCQGKLFFTDNQTIKYCDAATGENLATIPGLLGERFNDLATDGNSVWVSDNGASKILCVQPDGTSRAVKSPLAPNGVTCWRGQVFAVSWDRHDLYELDPKGVKEPVAFGLAEHFTNLDGIEVLGDGTFIVSDFQGHKVSAVTPDRKTVYTLIEMTTPADIGLDREKGYLFVPQFLADKAFIYRLSKSQ